MRRRRQVGAPAPLRGPSEEAEEAEAGPLGVSSEAKSGMSAASKLVLGASVVLTLATVTAVHLQQARDRQVGHPEPERNRSR